MSSNIDVLKNTNGLALLYEKRLNSSAPFLGETFFPQTKVGSGDLKYYIQKQSANLLAQPSRPDADDVTPDNYAGFSSQIFNTKFFRTAGVISEQDLMDINNASTHNDDALLDQLLINLYQAQSEQLMKQRSRREWMAMNALVNSKIEIAGVDPVVYTRDPDFQTDGDDWDNPNADIFGDITSAIDAMRRKGIYPNQIIMSLEAFRKMQKNKKIKTTYSAVGTNTDNFMMLQGNLVDAIKSEFHITPVVYDQGYDDGTLENFTFNKYLPDNMVILLNGPIDPNYAMNGNSGIVTNSIGSSQSLGSMAFAPTPEELKARNGSLVGDLQIFDTGVAYHTFENTPNAQTESRTVQNCLPAFEQSRYIFRMNIGATKNDGTPKNKPQQNNGGQGQSQDQQNNDDKNKSGDKNPATA